MLSVVLSRKDGGGDEQALPRMRLDGIAPVLRTRQKILPAWWAQQSHRLADPATTPANGSKRLPGVILCRLVPKPALTAINTHPSAWFIRKKSVKAAAGRNIYSFIRCKVSCGWSRPTMANETSVK